ncbi:MAG: hypothetical protein ACREHG_03735 [Candidatus Saccharimonadales bacterium]
MAEEPSEPTPVKGKKAHEKDEHILIGIGVMTLLVMYYFMRKGTASTSAPATNVVMQPGAAPIPQNSYSSGVPQASNYGYGQLASDLQLLQQEIATGIGTMQTTPIAPVTTTGNLPANPTPITPVTPIQPSIPPGTETASGPYLYGQSQLDWLKGNVGSYGLSTTEVAQVQHAYDMAVADYGSSAASTYHYSWVGPHNTQVLNAQGQPVTAFS